MTEEEKKAIDYLKNDVVYWLDKGKDFVVIDIGENEKLHSILNLIDEQKKEIEEKSTIIMAGAEKVKQLEKGNRSLIESRIKWKNRYYKEKAKNKEYIPKQKIRDILNYLNDIELNNYEIVMAFRKMIKELLEDNDGDHIPRID